MTENAFFDTNILIYALSKQDRTKARRARKLMDNGGVLSSQVVTETCANLLRKLNYSEDLLEKVLTGIYAQFRIIQVGKEVFLGSRYVRERYKFSYWDSLIVAAALEAGCDTLYSEDLQHGQEVSRIAIINPFIAAK